MYVHTLKTYSADALRSPPRTSRFLPRESGSREAEGSPMPFNNIGSRVERGYLAGAGGDYDYDDDNDDDDDDDVDDVDDDDDVDDVDDDDDDVDDI